MSANVGRVRVAIESAFPELWAPTEAALAAVLTLALQDVQNPTTLIFSGPASSGKTTVLDFVSDLDGLTYRSDRFSPAALVSHASNVKREKLAEVDLLPRIQHKALVTPELAPMFRGSEESLTGTFATLTAVLDGHGFISDSGTHGRRGYTGDYMFAWLGATTPLPTHVWKIMAQLGSRLAARDALLTVKREQKVLGSFVFCSPEGRFLHNLERDWRPALEAAEIPDFRFHDCRHTFASRLAMTPGVDLYTVQRAGGWKSQAMVQRYAHLSPDYVRAAVDRMARTQSEGGTGTKTGTGATG